MWVEHSDYPTIRDESMSSLERVLNALKQLIFTEQNPPVDRGRDHSLPINEQEERGKECLNKLLSLGFAQQHSSDEIQPPVAFPQAQEINVRMYNFGWWLYRIVIFSKTNPLRLQRIAVIKIREAIGGVHFQRKVKLLEIPLSLQSQIICKY